MDTNLPTSEIARALAAKRRQVERTCPVCGATYTGVKTKRFCSNRCAQHAAYLRRKARVAPDTTQEGQP